MQDEKMTHAKELSEASAKQQVVSSLLMLPTVIYRHTCAGCTVAVYNTELYCLAVMDVSKQVNT